MKKVVIILFISLLNHLYATAQSTDSLQTSPKKKFNWLAPTLLIGTGTIGMLDKDADEFFINKLEIREERNENFGGFVNHLDDYLQHVPSASVFILSLTGVDGKHDLKNQTKLYLKAELFMLATVYSLKYTVGEARPDTGKKNSFPSGHTAQAFTAATFLAKEYGHKSVWISIGAYTAATTVGVFRLLNNRHWITDVLVGAGIGILSTEVAYLTHRNKAKRKHEIVFQPFTGYDGSKGLSISIGL